MLGGCKLSDERVAACYIFRELRELCVTAKAADSLWEFEYKYRHDHKLLGTLVDFGGDRRRHLIGGNENATPKHAGGGGGAIGRAVRKLTPRKASLVNLLKGKGWNRNEESTHDLTIGSVEESLLGKY